MASILGTATIKGKDFNKVAKLEHGGIYVYLWIEEAPPDDNAESLIEFETSGAQDFSWYEVHSGKLVPTTVQKS